MASKDSQFYLRYYVGHQGRHGHEFLEFEVSDGGRLRYANNSNYRNDSLIRKEMYLSPMTIQELKRIVTDSEIVKEDDTQWPKKNVVGRQEIEVRIGNDHISFETAKIGSLVDVQASDDPEGLRVFYYLVQDLRIFVFSLIALHFRIKPVCVQRHHSPPTCVISHHHRPIRAGSRAMRKSGFLTVQCTSTRLFYTTRPYLVQPTGPLSALKRSSDRGGTCCPTTSETTCRDSPRETDSCRSDTASWAAYDRRH